MRCVRSVLSAQMVLCVCVFACELADSAMEFCVPYVQTYKGMGFVRCVISFSLCTRVCVCVCVWWWRNCLFWEIPSVPSSVPYGGRWTTCKLIHNLKNTLRDNYCITCARCTFQTSDYHVIYLQLTRLCFMKNEIRFFHSRNVSNH